MSSNNIIKQKLNLALSFFGLFLTVTFLAGIALASSATHADQTCITDETTGATNCSNYGTPPVTTTASATASVNVSTACTLSATGTTHSATLTPGQFTGNIGGNSTFTAICNDPGGYAIYAVGYSNDEWKNTTLINTTDSSLTIPTGTATSGNTSNWSMKLSNATADSDVAATIVSPYNDYAIVPGGSSLDPNDKQGGYAKVATRSSRTTAGTTTGTSFTTTYGAYIAATQAAGTYTGKVKYTLVNPSTAEAPEASSCKPSGTTISTIGCMQDISSSNKSSILNSMATNTQYTLVDSRDNKAYYVAKLADGNIWMTQNLDLDIDSSKTYTSADTDVSVAWTPSRSTYATDDTTWEWYTDQPESYDPGELCWNGTIDSSGWGGSLDDWAGECSSGSHYQIGNYYNWTAAVAMNDSSGYTEYDEDVDQSICPAGWMLPKSGDTLDGSGSFYYLVDELSLTAGVSGNIHLTPVYFPYAGYWYGVSGEVGGYGFYRSSVVYDDFDAFELDFGGHGYLNPQGYNGRGNGYSVRCVAR